MQTLLLKKAIESKSFSNAYPNIALDGSILTGSLSIHTNDRIELLTNMFDKNIDSNLDVLGVTTTVTFVSDTSTLELDSYSSNKVSKPFKENVGYGSYKEKLDLGTKKINCITEELQTVLVTTTDGKTSGVYGFELDLTHYSGQVTLYLKLDQIYVEPQYKDSTDWMDLTIAVYSFTNEVISCLSKILPKPYYFDIYVCADFLNKSDEDIANIILREVKEKFEGLPVIMPSQPAFIGGVVADMGY